MTLVMDAPSLMRWLFASTDEPETAEFCPFLAETPLLVPPGWDTDIRAILLEAERSHLIDAADTAGLMDDLAALTGPAAAPGDPATVTALARKHQLSMAEAAHLDLAARTGALLATTNQVLALAAADEGVKTL